jgi:hypothetical protein
MNLPPTLLSRTQLLALSTLVYAIHRTHFGRRGLTVGQLAGELLSEINHGHLPKNPIRTSRQEWQLLLQSIIGDQHLAADRIARLYFYRGLLVFVAKDRQIFPRDVAVVFRGTATLTDWDDNAMSAYLSDSPLQLKAYQYLRRLPLHYGRRFTLTGHSKGGNYAQYLAVRSARASRAIAFDASGFSPEFIAKYHLQNTKHAHRITNISAAADIVHAILTQLPGAKQLYIKTPPQTNPLLYHKPTALLDLQTNRFYPAAKKDAIPPKLLAEVAVKASDKLSLAQRKKLAHQATELVKTQFIKAIRKSTPTHQGG